MDILQNNENTASPRKEVPISKKAFISWIFYRTTKTQQGPETRFQSLRKHFSRFMKLQPTSISAKKSFVN